MPRSYGALLPGFRRRTDKATLLGILLLGAAVSGVDTLIRKDHLERLLHDLCEKADLRLEAAR